MAAVESLEGQHHQSWLDGVELLRDATVNKWILSTGLAGLDSFLHGGLWVGQLTELVGQSSSGKTQFWLRFASSVAKINRRSSVVYIDTGNSFSSRRIEQFVRKNQERTDIVQSVMSRISCHSVFDIFSLFDTLHQFEFKLRSSQESREEQDCVASWLLIIDSVSSLITPILGGSSSQGHPLMTSLGFLLKKLAHKHNIAVLVTDHMVGGEGRSLKPALGESWKSIPHMRLLISRSHGSNACCNVSILKHPSLASGRSASFTME